MYNICKYTKNQIKISPNALDTKIRIQKYVHLHILKKKKNAFFKKEDERLKYNSLFSLTIINDFFSRRFI
jgi:hypothetical protein